jgi:hypothetical protein
VTSLNEPRLRATVPGEFKFVQQSVTQTSCSPGACNMIALELAITAALDDTKGTVSFVINGFAGMDEGCSDDGSSIVLNDVVSGRISPLTFLRWMSRAYIFSSVISVGPNQ